MSYMQIFVMGTQKCCVGGCNATSETNRLFSFPKNDELRNLWLSFLVPTNSLLIGLSKEQLLRKRVCEKHFDRHQFDYEGRRLRYSYPCLFSDQEIAHGVPLSAAGWDVTQEHNYFKEQDEEEVTEHSPVTLTTGRADSIEHSYFKKQDDNNFSKSGMSDSGRSYELPPCSHFPTVASVKQNKDVIFEQTPCSSTGYTEVVMETIPAVQTPKQKSSTVSKFGSKTRKFIKRVRKIAAESSGNSAAHKLSQALCIEKEELFQKFNLLNKQAQTFLLMQLKQVQKSKMARRFTLDEKLMALLIMKQSPKGYRLLEKMFTLPNKRTLIRLSEMVSIEPGLNAKIFEHIAQKCKTWDTKQKLCTIVFDEVALTPHLTFNEKKEKIVGFVDVAGERKLKFSDHALVFMLRGICSPWRQSVAYYFCEGTVSAAELQNILKQMVSQVALTGLIPLGLVCDQGSTFRTAIRKLREDTIKKRNLQGAHDDGSVNIGGHDLCVFHDPPHLLKGLRNNFMDKDIIWEGKTASWNDIKFVYNIDSQLGHTKALPKVTANHVDASKMKKMKVSIAAQVLSARMAAMLKYTNAVNKIHSTEAETTMATTADVVEFFDKLFDSVNGYPGGAKKGKLRRAIKKDSPHHAFWIDAIKKIKSINFIDKCSKHAVQSGRPRFVKVPSLKSWIITLESFIRISKLLFDKYGVDYYYPRHINQDPLENFFGRIRALNSRNVNPDPNTFVYSFKSLLISNVLSPHSKFSNCEEDDGETLLNVKCLFINKNSNKENTISGDDIELPSFSQQCVKEKFSVDQVIFEKIKVHCSAYTAGFVCRKISKAIKCKACLHTYTSRPDENIHSYIQFREYKLLKNNNLVYPNERILILYRDVASLIHNYLNINCYKYNLKRNLTKLILSTMRYSWLGCAKHHKVVVDTFINVILRLQVHNWCNIINKILKGALEEKYIIKMGEPQKRALTKYKSFRLRKKCLNK